MQSFVLAALPFAAILLSTVAAFDGNRHRERAETDVARKFEMVAGLSDLLLLMVNAETGTRGYLLTHRTEFLQPYRRAASRLPAQLNDLQNLAQAEPGLKPRLDKLARIARIRKLVARQMALLTSLTASESAPAVVPFFASKTPEKLLKNLSDSKIVMDALRLELRAMHSEEDSLLNERLSEIQAVRKRDYIVIFLTLIVGLISRIAAGFLTNSGLNRRVRNLTDNVRALQQNQPLPHNTAPRPDTLSDLENEIASFARSNKENTDSG